jgi:hypothetical protein
VAGGPFLHVSFAQRGGEKPYRVVAKIPDKFPVRTGLILLSRSKPLELSNLGPQIGNSLLIPVRNSKIAEFGHKSRILSGKTENSLEISLLLEKSGFSYGFQL